MPNDIRSFLKEAEEAGKVYRVTREVDPYKNLAALSDEADRIILFENVAGYKGWTVAANLARDRELEAIAFKTAKDDVVRTVARGLDKGPQPHNVVKSGPVKEVIWHGDEANVKRLPIAIHSELDGGPYIGAGIGIVVDPDTGFHNTTFPRVQARDGKNLPFMIYSPHVGQIFSKYARRKQPMPMAIVIGHHPAWEYAAASSLHHPFCGELDYVGSLLGEETEFVRCETIDVDVPAWAEIVIEGETLPGVVADEGPFGNYLGTYASTPTAKAGVQKAPVFNVKCITMRKNPIFRHLQGTVWTDHQRLVMLPIEASLYTALSEQGLMVHDIYNPSWGACSLTLMQVTPFFPGQVRDALLKALEWENTTLGLMSQVAIAVNRDVNIYDARDIMWGLTIRTNWAKDATIVPGTRSSSLMPAADKVEGVPFRIGSKVMIDATHLPPRNETEQWEYNRVWPMGKGTVALEDYVEGFKGTPLKQERIAAPGAAAAPPTAGAPQTKGTEFVTVARLRDLQPGVGRCVTVADEQIALFRVDSTVYAVNNICPHQGGSLADGQIEGTMVVCPVHGWAFDVTSGQVVHGAASIDAYEVRVEGDEVKVGVPK